MNEFYKENKYLRLFPSLQYRQLYRLIKEKKENKIRKIFYHFVNYQINYYELYIIDKDKKIKKDFKGIIQGKIGIYFRILGSGF